MAEVTTGIRSVLSHARIFEAFSRLVGRERARDAIIHDHLRPQAGTRMLDIGCGTGDMFAHMPPLEYTGLDINERYIEHARERFGSRADFRVASGAGLPSDLSGFDVAMAIAVLHHLDDDEARSLLAGAAAALAPGGRFVSVDPLLAPGQSRAARAVISRDRGQHVRDAAAYAALAETAFGSVRARRRDDLLRIPYTHLVLECSEPRATTRSERPNEGT
jgi:SAM-dependent methyltransferase